MLLLHGVQHARRRRGFRRCHHGPRIGKRIRVQAAALRLVKRSGKRRAFAQQLFSPLGQRHLLAIAQQPQARLTSARCRQVLVVFDFGNFLRCVGRAGRHQAMQQKHVQKPGGFCGNAHRHQRVQVHQAHFHVFHPAFAQRVQRALAGPNHTFGANRAVKLVFNLQQAGAQLVVITARVANAHSLIRRVRLRQRLMERAGITLQIVVAHRQRGLRIALVAQAPHAQRRGVGQIHGVWPQGLQRVRATLCKTGTQRGRRAKQEQQHKCIAAKVANQPEILLAGHAGHGPVVVNAANGLHAATVAVPQAHAVHAFGAPHVGAAKARNRNGFVNRQPARHAGRPQPLLPLRRQRAVHELVDFGQLSQASADGGVRPGNQLNLRFAVIGGDVRVRQRRAQRHRMRRQRQVARRLHAQALFFNTPADAGKGLRTEGVLQGTHEMGARGRLWGPWACHCEGRT